MTRRDDFLSAAFVYRNLGYVLVEGCKSLEKQQVSDERTRHNRYNRIGMAETVDSQAQKD